MQKLKEFAVILLCCAIATSGQGNSFDKVRYNGGSVDSKVGPKDWQNHLTVTSDMITLALKDGKKLELPPKSVNSLSYGQEAHRRVADMVALSLVATPLALFGILHQSKTHFIGIEYRTGDGKPGALLLEADKNNYRAILRALEVVTGKPVKNAP